MKFPKLGFLNGTSDKWTFGKVNCGNNKLVGSKALNGWFIGFFLSNHSTFV